MDSFKKVLGDRAVTEGLMKMIYHGELESLISRRSISTDSR